MRQGRFLVTGAAGFIGSHLCERLLADGHLVRGVDRFSPFYDRAVKESNLAACGLCPGFELVEADLARADLEHLLADVQGVFHLAAQPGVRDSWGPSFTGYVSDNVVATQRLLEALSDHPVPMVMASSSSVYGDAETLPVPEGAELRPVSPYGLTKLTAEHLAAVYGAQRGTRVVTLRYFTVYGPRQRPDMAFTRLIGAAVAGEPLRILGDGAQSRDFTYVADAVDASVRGLDAPAGAVYNVGGGQPASLDTVLGILPRLLDRPLVVLREPAALGDVRHTWADTSRVRADLGWVPRTSLLDGLAAQVAWAEASAPLALRSGMAAASQKSGSRSW